MKNPIFTVLCFSWGLGAIFSSSSDAAVIDLFVDGPQKVTIESPNGGIRVQAQPTTLSGSLFTKRELTIQYGVQVLEVDVTTTEMRYRVQDTSSAGNSAGYYNIVYTAQNPVDLLASDSLSIEVIFSVLMEVNTFPTMGLEIQDFDGNKVSGRGTTSTANGVTRKIFSFADFARVDLHRVETLNFNSFRLPKGYEFAVTSIRTVPEPAMPLLLSVAFASITCRRRRSH